MTWMQGEEEPNQLKSYSTDTGCTGWVTVFAWMAACTSICFITATQIQGLIILNDSSYVFERWHGTLLSWVRNQLTLPSTSIIGLGDLTSP